MDNSPAPLAHDDDDVASLMENKKRRSRSRSPHRRSRSRPTTEPATPAGTRGVGWGTYAISNNSNSTLRMKKGTLTRGGSPRHRGAPRVLRRQRTSGPMTPAAPLCQHGTGLLSGEGHQATPMSSRCQQWPRGRPPSKPVRAHLNASSDGHQTSRERKRRPPRRTRWWTKDHWHRTS